MTICDRCQRIATKRIEDWDVCLGCYADSQVLMGGFIGRKVVAVKKPDVVVTPVEADPQKPSDVSVT